MTSETPSPTTIAPVEPTVLPQEPVQPDIHNNNFDINFNVDMPQLMEWVSKTFHPETSWLQDHQLLVTGLCAIAAAGLALLGSIFLARSQVDAGLKLDKQKSDREDKIALKAWEGKKRFLVFDVLNASTDASKYIHYAAGYIHNFEDDETPTEYMIFRKEIAFDEIDNALDRVSVRASFYPLKEEELRYLTDDEMSVTKQLDFFVASLKSKSQDMREMWQKFLDHYRPEEFYLSISQPPEDFANAMAIQNSMYALVKDEVQALVDEAKKLEKLCLKFAQTLAPEIGKEWEEARAKAEKAKRDLENA